MRATRLDPFGEQGVEDRLLFVHRAKNPGADAAEAFHFFARALHSAPGSASADPTSAMFIYWAREVIWEAAEDARVRGAGAP